MIRRFVLLLTLSAGPVLAETPAWPPCAALRLTCTGCHSDSTPNAPSDIPPLKSLTPESLASKLIAFQKNTLTGTVMNRISQGLSFEDIQCLSQSFRALP